MQPDLKFEYLSHCKRANFTAKRQDESLLTITLKVKITDKISTFHKNKHYMK